MDLENNLPKNFQIIFYQTEQKFPLIKRIGVQPKVKNVAQQK